LSIREPEQPLITALHAAMRPAITGGVAVRRRRAPLGALLTVGAILRLLALVAVYPGIWFSDSNNYVRAAATGTLSVQRVSGYALFVAPFWRLGSVAALIVAQHLLGLGIVAVLYALLVRRGVSPWLAALAAAPAALDAYLIDIEHMVMSETVFHAALVGGVALLLWPDRPGLPAAAGAGGVLGYAAVVRSVALPLVAVIAVYLLVRGVGWRPLAAFLGGWVVVAGAYAVLFDAQHGHLGFTGYGGHFLYAQVAPFADCAQLGRVPAAERRLCPDPRHRLTRNGYLWGPRTPIHGLGAGADGRIRDFAMRVIRRDPFAYGRLVAGSLAHYFEPGHHVGRNDYPYAVWRFPTEPASAAYPGYRGPIRPAATGRRSIDPGRYIGAFAGPPRTDATASRLLHAYQRVAYSSGQVLTPCLLLVLVALAAGRGRRRLRCDAALLAAAALTLLIVASALSLFDYRYALGATILLPAAAAFAATALWERGASAG
jgi:hypothetical protein